MLQKQIEQQIDNSEGVLERLKRLRDQRIAHHDAVPTPGDRSVLYGEGQQLVEAIKDMYNRLRRGHDGVYTSFDRLSRDAESHTAKVVRIMREERDRDAQRIREADAKANLHREA